MRPFQFEGGSKAKERRKILNQKGNSPIFTCNRLKNPKRKERTKEKKKKNITFMYIFDLIILLYIYTAFGLIILLFFCFIFLKQAQRIQLAWPEINQPSLGPGPITRVYLVTCKKTMKNHGKKVKFSLYFH